MEKLLEKLGATYSQEWEAWRLFRIKSLLDLSELNEWLLIGEITEALREVNCCTFEAHCDDRLGWKLIVDQRDRLGRYQPHNYIADTLLDCYIKAGEELL